MSFNRFYTVNGSWGGGGKGTKINCRSLRKLAVSGDNSPLCGMAMGMVGMGHLTLPNGELVCYRPKD